MVDHGDLDGDGVTDLVVAALKGGEAPAAAAQVMIGNGDGTFSAGERLDLAAPAATVQAVGAVIEDVVGDENLDIVAVSAGAAEVRIFPGEGGGTFAEPISIAVTASTGGRPGPHLVRTADMDGDGHPDIVVSSWVGPVSVLMADGEGGFAGAAAYPLDTTANVRDVGVADLTGDGAPEGVVG